MADIYKRFTTEDVIAGDVQSISSTVWSGDVNPLTTFFTGSSTASFEYYVPVYDKNPITDNSSAVQFSIAYGHIAGSGSLGTTTIIDNTTNTPSKAIYNQYVNLLLPPSQRAFTINGGSTTDFYAITINRARYKQKLDPGNWQLNISGSSSKSHFIDGSGAGDDPTINAAGRIFNIYSGSGAVTASTTVYGLAYPDLGILIFSSSIASSAGVPINRASATAAKNAVSMSLAISQAAYFAARTEERVTSNHYFVRVTNQQFNFSNNPTFITGSNGIFKWSTMNRNPQVYITTIGLYDDNNRLLAVAKLSRPLLKTFNREALVKVKIDY